MSPKGEKALGDAILGTMSFYASFLIARSAFFFLTIATLVLAIIFYTLHKEKTFRVLVIITVILLAVYIAMSLVGVLYFGLPLTWPL